MKVNISMDLPIKAIPIDSHYGLADDKYDVAEIHMGQSNTSIKLLGCAGKTFNSVHFKFMLHNREIDIYSSGLISPYFSLQLPMICYVKEQL